jgi:hypothetical protein
LNTAAAGEEILAWLQNTGCESTIYQDIDDTKNILSELKKQNEELRSQHHAAEQAADPRRRPAKRAKSKTGFAEVDSDLL